MPSILKEWVSELGLRHQGVLVSSIRGCDTAPKDDPSKLLSRTLRGIVLNAHCGDPVKARSFIESIPDEDLYMRMNGFLRNRDHYPHHYVSHLMHAAEIIGYKCPLPQADIWMWFYLKMCKQLHVNPESEVELDLRLNADEDTFATGQVVG